MKLKLSTFEVLLGNYCPFFFSHKIQFLVRSLLFSQNKLDCCCLHVLVFRTETPIRHQSPSFVGLHICFYLLNRKIISLRYWLYIYTYAKLLFMQEPSIFREANKILISQTRFRFNGETCRNLEVYIHGFPVSILPSEIKPFTFSYPSWRSFLGF